MKAFYFSRADFRYHIWGIRNCNWRM